jgi:hypothetical protein
VTTDVTISITVDARTAAYLRALTRSTAVRSGTLEDVLRHLVCSAADGLRRPGAWERGWLEQAFGDFPEGPQTDGVPYAHLEPVTVVHIDEIDESPGAPNPCGACGMFPVVDVHLTDGCWDCLGCVGKYDEPALEPAELAAAALLVFVHRCFTEREDRPRCVDCNGRRNLYRLEAVAEGQARIVCRECLDEEEREWRRATPAP